jgi:hypothetical protein
VALEVPKVALEDLVEPVQLEQSTAVVASSMSREGKLGKEDWVERPGGSVRTALTATSAMMGGTELMRSIVSGMNRTSPSLLEEEVVRAEVALAAMQALEAYWWRLTAEMAVEEA